MPCSLSASDEDAPITAADALGSVVIGVIQARATVASRGALVATTMASSCPSRHRRTRPKCP
jgi:hypothetical protein